MKKLFLSIILLLFAIITFTQDRNFRLVKSPTENPTNQQRKAVVIGMSDYGEGRALNNTLNDANDMAAVLTQLGFEVTLLKNNDLRNLKNNLNNWYNTIEGNDMAIFYFAGHGMEVNGENYLIPVDAELTSQTDVEYNALNVNQILGNMDERKVGMKLLILDACRNNPFKRSWSRGSEEKGLAQMAAPKGTYIAFAASPGFTAQDGDNYSLKNGVFTYYLKQEIIKEGVTIDEIFNNVTGDVSSLTNNQQTPFKNSSLTKNFFFKPKANPQSIETLKKYYYYIDQDGNKSSKNFERQEEAESEMRAKKLYGKIYSNNGEVFIVDASIIPNKPIVVNKTEVQQKLDDANDFVTKHKYDEALAIYKNVNEQNLDATAMYNLGKIYFTGGANQDFTQAMNWTQKAINAKSTDAMLLLGRMYQLGIGVTDDYKWDFVKAKNWYQKAADAGNTNALVSLASLYFDGKGVPKDSVLAKNLVQKAADAGNSNAMIFLAFLSSKREVTSQVISWLQKAAGAGNLFAMHFLGEIYKQGEGVNKDYKIAKNWLQKATDAGNVDAFYSLGSLYSEGGYGIIRDTVQAKYWINKSIDAGSSEAMTSLASGEKSYSYVDSTQIFHLIETTAERGNSGAMERLAGYFEYGEMVKQDYTQAIYWLQKSLDAWNNDNENDLFFMEVQDNYVQQQMQYRLIQIGDMYMKLDSNWDNRGSVKKWYQKAVDLGSDEAMLKLGNIYMGENFMPYSFDDFTKAQNLYKKAADKGNAHAMLKLGDICYRGFSNLISNVNGKEIKTEIKKDYKQAKIWYQKGLNKEKENDNIYQHSGREHDSTIAAAMQNLARIYYYGYADGVKDAKKAKEWKDKANEKFNNGGGSEENNRGDTDVVNNGKDSHKTDIENMLSTANNYRFGNNGITIDYAQAKNWYQKAADKGNTDAMQNLGDLYKEGGNGLTKDYEQAKYWYEKAVNAGNKSSMYWLGLLYQYDIIDYIKAKYWYEKDGNSLSIESIGKLYQEGGNGLTKDFIQAKQWFEKAINSDTDKSTLRDCYFDLGELYQEGGYGLDKDYKQAINYYQKSVDNGWDYPMKCMAALYTEGGYGITKNYTQAKYLYEELISKTKTDDDYNIKWVLPDYWLALGKILQEGGNGITQDYILAKYWFQKAADKGESEAMAWVGYLYEFGYGVTQDYAQAKYWYQKSADAGNDWSRKKLAGWNH